MQQKQDDLSIDNKLNMDDNTSLKITGARVVALVSIIFSFFITYLPS